MAMVQGKSRNSEQDANMIQEIIDRKDAEAMRLATKERMIAKSKGAEWRPLPRRGDVKKGIVTDFKDGLKGCARTLKNSRIAPERDGSVSFEENGQ